MEKAPHSAGQCLCLENMGAEVEASADTMESLAVKPSLSDDLGETGALALTPVSPEEGSPLSQNPKAGTNAIPVPDGSPPPHMKSSLPVCPMVPHQRGREGVPRLTGWSCWGPCTNSLGLHVYPAIL